MPVRTANTIHSSPSNAASGKARLAIAKLLLAKSSGLIMCRSIGPVASLFVGHNGGLDDEKLLRDTRFIRHTSCMARTRHQ